MDSAFDMLMTMHYTNLRFIIIIQSGGEAKPPPPKNFLVLSSGMAYSGAILYIMCVTTGSETHKLSEICRYFIPQSAPSVPSILRL